jgi:hypothetical protein
MSEDTSYSGYSPSALQHQGIRALSNDPSDAMGDLSDEEVEAFSVLRAINTRVKMPMVMSYIGQQISLSRARNRMGRLEYAGCYKSYPPVIVGAGGASLPGMQQDQKPGFISRMFSKKKQAAEETHK